MAALGAAGLAPERRSARGCSQRCAGQEVPQHPGGTDRQVGARAVSPPAPAARTGGALRQGPWLASSARSGTGLLTARSPSLHPQIGFGKGQRGASGQRGCGLFSEAGFRTQVTFHPRAALSIGSQGKSGEKGGIKCREQNWCSSRGCSLGDSFTCISKPAASCGTCGWRQNFAQVPRLQAVRYVIVCNVRLCDSLSVSYAGVSLTLFFFPLPTSAGNYAPDANIFQYAWIQL